MSFFKDADPVKDANVELHNRLITYVNHATYNSFHKRVEEGRPIEEHEILQLAQVIHPPMLEVSEIGLNSVKRLIVEYISNEWGMEAYGLKSVCQKPKDIDEKTIKRLKYKMKRLSKV